MSVAGAKQNCALDQWTALADQCLHSAEADVRPPKEEVRVWTHLCHSMSNLAALHSSVLAQRCGNVRLPA